MKACFSSNASTIPLLFVSKMSKAPFTSRTSSIVTSAFTQSSAFHTLGASFTGATDFLGGGGGGCLFGLIYDILLIRLQQILVSLLNFAASLLSAPSSPFTLHLLSFFSSNPSPPWQEVFVLQFLYYILNSMLEIRAGEREFHKETLLQKLRLGRDTLATPHLYTEGRAAAILGSIVTLSEMFATGLTEVHSGESLRQKERELGKTVVVAVMNEQGLAEIQRVLHLFSEVFVVNLTVSGNEVSQAMRVSPLRRRLKGFVEVSLNFFPCLNGLFSVNRAKQGRRVGLAEGITSYLLSLPKFHEFHIYFSKSDSNNHLVAAVEQTLNSKLAVLQRHGSSQYKESGSPRVTLLIIDRKLDPMSPLLYSYYYGPIAQELGVLGEQEEFTTKSALYSALFSMDIQEAGVLLRRLSEERAENKKITIENKQVQQIKKAITLLCDTTASPREIQVQLNSLTSIREFCQRRAATTALQQTILNNLSEAGQKMSPSKIIDRLIELAGLPLEEFKPSQEDYAKMVMVAYMVNSFWFFHRKILNAGLKDHPRRDQLLAFCKKHQNTCRPLPEKPQGEERYDLYRHQPAILTEIDAWVSKSKEFEARIVNRSSANRQTRRVIAVDGPLGYNQACLIQRYFREKDPNGNVTVLCSQLMNTKEYQEYLLRGEGNRS